MVIQKSITNDFFNFSNLILQTATTKKDRLNTDPFSSIDGPYETRTRDLIRDRDAS